MSKITHSAPWGSRNTYQYLTELQLDIQQSSETLVTFPLLELAVPQNVRQTGPFSALGRWQNRFSSIALFFENKKSIFFMNCLNSCQNQSILSPISFFFTKCPLGPTLLISYQETYVQNKQ